MEAIRYQGFPYNSLPDLWHAFHSSYNAAANRSVQLSILDDVPCLAPWSWVSFSMLEMSEALKACSNVSAPGPDHITWRYLKSILADSVMPDSCLGNKSDIFHHNNENNQLERQVQPPRDIH